MIHGPSKHPGPGLGERTIESRGRRKHSRSRRERSSVVRPRSSRMGPTVPAPRIGRSVEALGVSHDCDLPLGLLEFQG
jgi:hypothetical protein